MVKLDVIDQKGGSLEKVEFSKDFMDVPFNEGLVHQIVTSVMSCSRQGSKAQKNRSRANGGGAKPWRQKGTGRARAGTSRSPIWVGGGRAFAAQPRSHSKKINKKMYRKAIACIFSELNRTKRLFIIDKVKLDKPKTKDMISMVKGLGFNDVLFITNEVSENEYLASRNLYHVDIRDCLDVDPVSLVAFETIVITQEALKYFEGLVS
jgi:large subunit ribosomal protein L4